MRWLLIAAASLLLPLLAIGRGHERQEIRDPSCRVIGTITTKKDGIRQARDRNCRLVANGDLLILAR